MTLHMTADRHRVAPPSKEEGVSPIECLSGEVLKYDMTYNDAWSCEVPGSRRGWRDMAMQDVAAGEVRGVRICV